jgi:hypothetical protein
MTQKRKQSGGRKAADDHRAQWLLFALAGGAGAKSRQSADSTYSQA